MIGIDEEFDNGQTLRFTSQLSHRWNSNGTLYYNELPRVCVTAPELDTSECVATMRNIPGLEAADLSPYYTLGDDGDDGKTWYAVGRWY